MVRRERKKDGQEGNVSWVMGSKWSVEKREMGEEEATHGRERGTRGREDTLDGRQRWEERLKKRLGERT